MASNSRSIPAGPRPGTCAVASIRTDQAPVSSAAFHSAPIRRSRSPAADPDRPTPPGRGRELIGTRGRSDLGTRERVHLGIRGRVMSESARTGPVLQRHRSGQPAGGRDACRRRRQARRPAHPRRPVQRQQELPPWRHEERTPVGLMSFTSPPGRTPERPSAEGRSGVSRAGGSFRRGW